MTRKRIKCAVCGRTDKDPQLTFLPVGKRMYCYECYAENGKAIKEPCAKCGWQLVTHVTANRTAYCQNCKSHYMMCWECGKPTIAVVYFFTNAVLCPTCSKNYTYASFKDKYGSIYGSIGQEIQFANGVQQFCWVAEGTKD